MKRLIPIPALLALLVVLPGAAGAADPGLTVLPFLQLGAGARAATFGDAFVSVADDASATYWNPAGLLRIPRNDVLGAHNAWIQDLKHEFAAAGFHRGRHAAGVSFIGLYTSDIEGRDETGAYTGHYGFSDNAFSVSYAFQATRAIGIGGTARYVRESVIGTTEGDFNLSGMAFDLGGTWDTPWTGVRAGATVRNLGGKLSYDVGGAEKFDLPTTLQAGLSYTRVNPSMGAITVSGDFVAERGQNAAMRVGAEYAYRGQFLLGAGYKTGLDNENVSFGVGYQNKVRVNYAFTPIYNDLGSSHRISLGYGW
jgi:hypothetical protein